MLSREGLGTWAANTPPRLHRSTGHTGHSDPSAAAGSPAQAALQHLPAVDRRRGAGEASVAGAPGPQGPSASLAARDSLGCTVSHWELRGVAELVARARTSHLSPETIMAGTSPADPWPPSGASTPPGMGSSRLHVHPAIPPQGRPARGDQLSTAL